MSDDDTIDDKKKNKSSLSADLGHVKTFVSTFLSILVVVVLYVSVGGVLLFLSKVAQTNRLPTDPKCAPYVPDPPPTFTPADPILSNLFANDKGQSMKVQFPDSRENQTFQLLEAFTAYKQKTDSHFFVHFLVAIAESILQFNFSVLTAVFSAGNALPETAFLLLYPALTALLVGVWFIVNSLYLIYAFFSQLGWLFKTNDNDTGNGPPQWRDIGLLEPLALGIGCVLALLSIVVFLLGFPLFSMIPHGLTLYCVAAALSFKGFFVPKDKDSSSPNAKRVVTVATVIQELLLQHKVSISYLLAVSAVLLAFSILGPIPGCIAVGTLGLIHWKVIPMSLFQAVHEDSRWLSPVVKTVYPTKQCMRKPVEHSLWYDVSSLVSSLLFKGGRSTKPSGLRSTLSAVKGGATKPLERLYRHL